MAAFPPAPLDPAALAQALAPFGESTMLPSAAYADPAVFDWERRHFFGGGWMCVARGDQFPKPGDQRGEYTGDGGVLLVRGDDQRVRAGAQYKGAPRRANSRAHTTYVRGPS